MTQLAARNGTEPRGDRTGGSPGAPPVARSVTEPPRRFALGDGEVRALHAVQRATDHATLHAAARGLSLFGEHAAGWLALGALGAAADRGRRREWVVAAAGVAAAHAASVVVKRVVRRTRPEDSRVRVLGTAPSRLSFPSAHATSTTAAAMLYGRLLRRTRRSCPPARALAAALVPAALSMGLSRLVLGVHYPSDVVAGSLLGVAVASTVGAAGVAARRPLENSS